MCLEKVCNFHSVEFSGDERKRVHRDCILVEEEDGKSDSDQSTESVRHKDTLNFQDSEESEDMND